MSRIRYLDRVRHAIRVRQYSMATEKACLNRVSRGLI